MLLFLELPSPRSSFKRGIRIQTGLETDVAVLLLSLSLHKTARLSALFQYLNSWLKIFLHRRDLYFPASKPVNQSQNCHTELHHLLCVALDFWFELKYFC